ncbi:hypothetical protein I4U23_003249 [Adineta vaga]|nr:hypothetical protein I4U23_003249 [Adineta vaga]
MNQLQHSHRQWLEELGVKIKTDLTFFHRTIVPNAATFIHPNNAESTIQRLFNLFINGETNVEHLRSVERLSLLTTTNKLIPANRLYLSAPYEPHLSLDSVLPSTFDLFVSPVYLQQNLLGEWKLFFCKLGVQENITFVKLNEDNRSFFTYNEDQRGIIFGLNSQQVHDYKYRETLTFLEYTEHTYEFARFFWSYVIKTIDIRRLNRSESALWGSRHKRGATEGSEVNSFPQWFVRTRSCIPVSILLANGQCQNVCYLASKVFTGRLKSLIGRYLPIFDCIDNLALLTDEWETFFRFRTELSIDDHLLLLKQIYVQNQKGIEYEDDIRIQNIYDSLSHKLCGIDQNQR